MEAKFAGLIGFILALLGVGGVAWVWNRFSRYLGLRTNDNNTSSSSGRNPEGSGQPQTPDADSVRREREVAESGKRTDSAKESFNAGINRIEELLRKAREQGKVVDSGDNSTRGDIPRSVDSGVPKESN